MPRTSNQKLDPDVTSSFREAPAWRKIEGSWRPIYGSFREMGFSVEWHDFTTEAEFDWASSFHPHSIEICINIAGEARLEHKGATARIKGNEVVFYHADHLANLKATRAAKSRHQFVTFEFAASFFEQYFQQERKHLHHVVHGLINGKAATIPFACVPQNNIEITQLVETLRRPPVFLPAQRSWFTSKAMEVAALFLFQPAEGELFCSRAKRAGHDRVEAAKSILRNDLQMTLSLDELAKKVGCSPFYLSRTFSQEAGMTIQQYLRKIRLERAAELLRTGQCNVTEAAMEVGYNSLSHFSTAFHEMYGSCPGLYSLKINPA
ncbi:MAG: helix-turn-helix transcriptional regulator [Verrucomicrobiales bacterium]